MSEYEANCRYKEMMTHYEIDRLRGENKKLKKLKEENEKLKEKYRRIRSKMYKLRKKLKEE